MDTISFDKLLLKSAFCCMASDGHIDNREIAIIKTMCENSPLFKDFNFQEEINSLVGKINTRGKEFISYYFDLLGKTTLTEVEELTLIDFAIQTIKADEHIEYSEIKFFKNIRHRLKISDENILAVYPDIEQFLEKDIVTDSYLDKIANQYLIAVELPQFDLINIDAISHDKLKKDE
ncbi:MAG: TerB family tellurite resistance protein [Bacteroidetes bacterium]|nr:TerB family tellurite resistance protein [Bacteroidota bacterium]